jgi:hypothetical protein
VEQELFSAALGLVAPWRVARSEFDAEAGRPDLYLDFPRGARFACPLPGCGERECRCTTRRTRSGGTWTSSSTGRTCTRSCRVRCPEHGVRQVMVSWVGPGSGFTLLFEALLITF